MERVEINFKAKLKIRPDIWTASFKIDISKSILLLVNLGLCNGLIFCLDIMVIGEQ